MYHSISDDPEQKVPPYFKTHVSPARFAEQMSYLAENGWKTVTMGQAAAKLKQGGLPGGKTVAITFDDGFRSFFIHGHPILSRNKQTATMFLPSAYIKDGKEGRGSFKGLECMTWEEVRELAGQGIEFGSHTVNHPKLVELSDDAVGRELRDSKSVLEDRLGRPVPAFAYPFAFPSRQARFVERLNFWLGDAGYECCVTTEVGRVEAGDDMYRLKRLPVNSCDDREFFARKLEGCYDWIGSIQQLAKRLKARKELNSSRAH